MGAFLRTSGVLWVAEESSGPSPKAGRGTQLPHEAQEGRGMTGGGRQRGPVTITVTTVEPASTAQVASLGEVGLTLTGDGVHSCCGI